jgi:hypothetical protein
MDGKHAVMGVSTADSGCERLGGSGCLAVSAGQRGQACEQAVSANKKGPPSSERERARAWMDRR